MSFKYFSTSSTKIRNSPNFVYNNISHLFLYIENSFFVEKTFLSKGIRSLKEAEE